MPSSPIIRARRTPLLNGARCTCSARSLQHAVTTVEVAVDLTAATSRPLESIVTFPRCSAVTRNKASEGQEGFAQSGRPLCTHSAHEGIMQQLARR